MKGIAEEFIKENLKKYKKDHIIEMKDIGRKGKLRFQFVEDRFYIKQYNLPEKVFFIDKLKKLKHKGKLSYPKSWTLGDIEYRIGYYIVSQYGKRIGHWIFGQFNPIIPLKDLQKIIQGAKNKKIIDKNFKIN